MTYPLLDPPMPCYHLIECIINSFTVFLTKQNLFLFMYVILVFYRQYTISVNSLNRLVYRLLKNIFI